MIVALVSALALGHFQHPNLLKNGDFEQGDKAFVSQYTRGEVAEREGTYGIGVDPNNLHSGGWSMGDHTTGSGRMLIANGATLAGRAVWQEQVRVSRHRRYAISGFTASWGRGGTFDDPSPARLQIVVNGKPVGAPILVKANDGWWMKFSLNWNSGNRRYATIRIVDLTTEPVGNDFALDDLAFRTR